MKRYVIKNVKSGLIALLASVLIYPACTSDDFDGIMEIETIPLKLGLLDFPPVPGNSGTITTMNITTSQVQLLWTIATDDKTSQADLEYRVVYSLFNDISTVQDALDNGIISMNWTANATSDTVSPLSSATTYYFNVLVRDNKGNMAIYSTVSATTN